MSDTLLSVRDLRLAARPGGEDVTLVDDVGFDLEAGQAVGIIGESGSGKSLLVRSIAGLLPSGVRVAAGRVELDGVDVTRARESDLRALRGSTVGMVFQDSVGSLDPLFTVGRQLVEAMRTHRKLSAAQARTEAIELLRSVGIGGAEARMRAYPHELSGGTAQRVAIAIAIANSPKLLIADEATTALDVTIQKQIISLIRRIQLERSCAVVFVSHDLATVASLVDRVVVMYAGTVVETGTTDEVLKNPRHPYTAALLRSKPRLGAPQATTAQLHGAVPLPGSWPTGCRFHPRCPVGRGRSRCEEEAPVLEGDGSRLAACHYPEETPAVTASPAGTGGSAHG